MCQPRNIRWNKDFSLLIFEGRIDRKRGRQTYYGRRMHLNTRILLSINIIGWKIISLVPKDHITLIPVLHLPATILSSAIVER